MVDVLERALANWSSELYTARMDGLNEGLVQGLTQGLVQGKVEGRMEGKTEIALRLANSNIPLDTIAEATGFSLEELKQLLKR